MMKKVMKTLLALAMAFVCGGAWAAPTAIAEWDGDFATSPSKIAANGMSYTFLPCGNAIENGEVTINQNFGAQVRGEFGSTGGSVLVKYRNLTTQSESTKALMGALDHQRNRPGVRMTGNGMRTVTGYYEGNTGVYAMNNCAPPEEGYILFSYATSSTAVYAGSSLASLTGGSNTGLSWPSSSSNLRKVVGFSIGGPQRNSTYAAWTGMVIEKVAVFSETYTGTAAITAFSDFAWNVQPTQPKFHQVIALNFNANAIENTSDAGIPGLPIIGSQWKQPGNVKNQTSAYTLAVYNTLNGQDVTGSTAPTATWNCDTTYTASCSGHDCNGCSSVIYGYLDDGNSNNKVTISNIPFDTYDVIALASTDDNNNYLFGTIKITLDGDTSGAKTYTYSSGSVVEGTTGWGAHHNMVPDFGVNAMRITNLSGSTIEINPQKVGGSRAGLAAVVIVGPEATAENSNAILINAMSEAAEYEFNGTQTEKSAIHLIGSNKVTLKNINSSDLAKLNTVGFTGEIQFVYELTADMANDTTLSSYIKTAAKNTKFIFVGGTSDNTPFGATVDLGTDNKTLHTHLVFRGGKHNFKFSNGNQMMAADATNQNPTVLVEGNGELNFYGHDITGWDVATDVNGVIGVKKGSTLNFFKYGTGTVYYSQRLWIEPGAMVNISDASASDADKIGDNAFRMRGGSALAKAQIFVPDSLDDKTDTPAIINANTANGICLASNGNSDDVRGIGVYVGENTKLKINGNIRSLNGANLDDNNKRPLAKYGKGTLALNGTVVANITIVNGDLEFSHDSDLTCISPIGGAGDVIKSGTGTLKLSGANTFTGKLYIDEGTVDLAATKTGGYDIVSKGNITTSVGGNAYSSYIKSLELTGDTMIGSEATKAKVIGFGYGSDTPSTSLNLGTHTLTVWEEGNFYFLNTTVSGSGTIDFKSGNFLLFTGNLSGTDATLKVAEGATLEPSGKNISFKNIEMNGSILVYQGATSDGMISVGEKLSGSGSFYKLTLADGVTIDATNGSCTVDYGLWLNNTLKVCGNVGDTVITKTGGYGETLPSVTRVDADGNTLPGTYSLTNADGVIKLSAQTSTEMTATELNTAGIMFIDSNASLTFDTGLTNTTPIQNLSNSEVTLTLKVSGDKKYVSAADIKKLNLGSNIKLAYDWNAGRVISINFGADGAAGVMSGETIDGTLGGNVKRDAWNNIKAASGTVAVPNGYQNGTTEYHVSGMSATITCNGNYRTNSDKTYPFMRRYLDDNNNNTTASSIVLNGVPFKTYDLVIYCQSDDDRNQFSPVKIVQGATETTYRHNDNGEVVSTDDTSVWGKGNQEFSYADNTIRITGLTGQAVTITSNKAANNRRSCFAAIQVVQTSTDDEDATLGSTVATVDGAQYKTLSAAVDAASEKIAAGAKTATITLAGDLFATAEVIPAGVIIEIGEHNLTGSLKLQSGAMITENGVVKIDGIATNFDLTFNGNMTIDYSDFGGSPGCNGTASYNNDANNTTTGIYLKHRPWVNGIEEFFTTTKQISFVTAGMMPDADMKIFAHMGDADAGKYGLFLATGTSADEVIVGYNYGTATNTITTMTVSNARTKRHVYVITKDDNLDTEPTSTTFAIYVDGERWTSFVREPRFEITGGLQVGSCFHHIVDGYQEAPDDGAYVNFMRAYQRIISDEEIARYSAVYPYVSENGKSERTFTAAAENWESEDAWKITDKDDIVTYAAMPLAGSQVIVTADVSTTITINEPAADVTFESLTVEKGASAEGEVVVTFDCNATEGVTYAIKPGKKTINTPVLNKHGIINFTTGPLSFGTDGKLTFDFSSLPAAAVAAEGGTKSEQVTGVTDAPAEKLALKLGTDSRLTAVLAKHADDCYYMDATVAPMTLYWNSANTAWNATTQAKDEGGNDVSILTGDTVVFDKNRSGCWTETNTLYANKSIPVCTIQVADGTTLYVGHDNYYDKDQRNPYNLPSGTTLDIGTDAHVKFRYWNNSAQGAQNYAKLGAMTINGAGDYGVDKSFATYLELAGTVTGTAKLAVADGDLVKVTGSLQNAVKGSGTGTIEFAAGQWPTDNETFRNSLKSEDWTGTIAVKGITGGVNINNNINACGRDTAKASSVKLSGVQGYFEGNTTVNPTLIIENGSYDYGLNIKNGSSNDSNVVTFAAITGSGKILGDGGSTAGFIVKDWTGFTGSLDMQTKTITFGTTKKSNVNKIIVDTTSVVQIGDSATWSANGGIEVKGTLKGAGLLSSATTFSAGSTIDTTAGLTRASATVTLGGNLKVKLAAGTEEVIGANVLTLADGGSCTIADGTTIMATVYVGNVEKTDRFYKLVVNGSAIEIAEADPVTTEQAIVNKGSLGAIVAAGGTLKFTGVGGVQGTSLSVPALCSFELDPIRTPVKINGDVTIDGKIKLSSAWDSTTLGKFTLLTYSGTLTKSAANLHDIVEVSGDRDYTVEEVESAENTGCHQLILKIGNYDTLAKPIKVMPLGDSITEGTNIGSYFARPNYRTQLMAKLEASGFAATSCGYQRSDDGCKKNSAGIFAPINHQWHCGMSGQECETLSTAGWEDSIDVALDAAGYPDIVTFKIGTNDMKDGAYNGKTAEEIADGVFRAWTNVLWKIRRARPNTKIVVGTVVTPDTKTALARTLAFNAKIEDFVTRSKAGEEGYFPGDYIYLADLYTACPRPNSEDAETIPYGDNFHDWLHPNWVGHNLTSDKWLEVIKIATANVVAKVPETVTTNTKKGAEANVDSTYRANMVKIATITPSATWKLTEENAAEAMTLEDGITTATKFHRVGYYMELQRKDQPGTESYNGHVRYVWADMDAFGDKTLATMGFPTGDNQQGVVHNLHVDSNDTGIRKVLPGDETADGFVEFTKHSYSGAGVSGGPANKLNCDWNDTLSATGVYGCMQIHRFFKAGESWNAGEVLMAYNRWTANDNNEIGIGSLAQKMSSTSIDYTFTCNLEKFSTTAYDHMSIEIWGELDNGEVAEVNGTKYNTLQNAIDAVATFETPATIKLLATVDVATEIPSHVTVTTTASAKLTGTITGSGVVVMDGYLPTDTQKTALADSTQWTGTLWLKNIYKNSGYTDNYWSLPANLGNASSTVRFTNVFCYLANNTTYAYMMDLVDDGSTAALTIHAGGNGHNSAIKLSGDGTIKNAFDNTHRIKIVDVESFTGSIFANGKYFEIGSGNDCSTQGKIVVDANMTATIGEDSTWTAPAGVIVNGTLTVDGTVSGTLSLGAYGAKIISAREMDVGSSDAAKKVGHTMVDGVYTYTLVDPATPIQPTEGGETIVVPVVPADGITIEPGAKVQVPTETTAITVKYGDTVLSGGENPKVTVTVNQTTGVVELTTTAAARPAATAIAMATPTVDTVDKVQFTITDPIPGLFYSIVSADGPTDAHFEAQTAVDSDGVQATNSDPHTTSIDMPTDAKVKYFRVRVKATK